MPESEGIENYVTNELFDDLLDTVVQGVCFEIHRKHKSGILFLDEGPPVNEVKEIVDKVGKDIFGQVPHKLNFECSCPNCKRTMAASRFAPHLEKCMGMGRNSSRLASRRIANAEKQQQQQDTQEDEGDDDWSWEKKRKKRDKNSPRRSSKKSKESSTKAMEGTAGDSYAVLQSMPVFERKELLNSTCCVISKHTGKMCNRSHQCPTHSDDQRRTLRRQLLPEKDEEFIDVDSLEDSNSNVAKSWESSPSPATELKK